MRTTTKQAYTIYKIITQVNPFEYGTDEKPFIIKELKENTLTDNLSNLIEWLKVQYDNDIFNIINDTILSVYYEIEFVFDENIYNDNIRNYIISCNDIEDKKFSEPIKVFDFNWQKKK